MTLLESSVSGAPSCVIILTTLRVSLTIVIFFIIYIPGIVNYDTRDTYLQVPLLTITIYNLNIFIVQATVVTYEDHHIFIVQATGFNVI
jgi:hypothetical protein